MNLDTFKRDRAAYEARMLPELPWDVPGGVDGKGHATVQAWSHGDLFPAVIQVVESYTPEQGFHDGPAVTLGSRLRYTAYDLLLDGRTERFATWEDAETAARALLADPLMRREWRDDPL